MELVQDNIQTDTDKYLSIMLESYENQLRQVEDGLPYVLDQVPHLPKPGEEDALEDLEAPHEGVEVEHLREVLGPG